MSSVLLNGYRPYFRAQGSLAVLAPAAANFWGSNPVTFLLEDMVCSCESQRRSRYGCAAPNSQLPTQWLDEYADDQVEVESGGWQVESRPPEAAENAKAGLHAFSLHDDSYCLQLQPTSTSTSSLHSHAAPASIHRIASSAVRADAMR